MGKISSIVGMALVGFLGSLEYSVVMPSLWFYLQQFGVESQIFYSVVLSSFSFAVMISSPIFGWLVDRRSMKELIVLGFIISIVGHAMYALAWDQWSILFGRLIAGVGAANHTLVAVYIARITTLENRTTVTARLNIFSELGLLLGPAFAILFEQMDFQWSIFEVNQYTAPGYLMFIVCLFLLFYILFFFDNPTKETQESEVTKPSPAINEDPSLDSKSSVSITPEKEKEREKSNFARIFTRGTITVFFAQFILFFNQTATEALVAPLTEEYYNFGPFETSLFFVGIMVVFLIMYAAISFISPFVQDRTLIGIGIAFEIMSLLSSSLIFILIEDPPFWLFVVSVFFFIVGLPFFFCCTSSLLSKLVEERDVGKASGVLSSVTNLANIVGPLWGGTFATEPYLPFVGALALVSILGCVYSYSFRTLYIPRTVKPEEAGEGASDEGATESSPLLK